MKFIRWTADSLIRQVVTIDESQFGFVPGRGTTDASFVICHAGEIFHSKQTNLHVYCHFGLREGV